jgi:catechol 2,3-dioxygenase-like lactoylglutathione lyase family enzyme
MAKVSHIVLPVSDVLRSREWYVNKLGGPPLIRKLPLSVRNHPRQCIRPRDESRAEPVDRLPIQLRRRLERHEPHARPLDGLANRFGIQ